MESLQNKFDERWIGEPNSGCWLWVGDANRALYGTLNTSKEEREMIGLRRVMAHRLSWLLHQGSIPDGIIVCHKCDTPSCVRPDHLFLGTDKTNAEDKVAKQRHAYGSKQWLTTLTEADVVAIRASNESIYACGRRYRIDPRTVSQIRNRTTWKHVPGAAVRDTSAALSNKGEAAGAAKLTNEKVREIRALVDAKRERHADIAARYGVSRAMVSIIGRREAWTHI